MDPLTDKHFAHMAMRAQHMPPAAHTSMVSLTEVATQRGNDVLVLIAEVKRLQTIERSLSSTISDMICTPVISSRVTRVVSMLAIIFMLGVTGCKDDIYPGTGTHGPKKPTPVKDSSRAPGQPRQPGTPHQPAPSGPGERQ